MVTDESLCLSPLSMFPEDVALHFRIIYSVKLFVIYRDSIMLMLSYEDCYILAALTLPRHRIRIHKFWRDENRFRA